MGCDPLNLHYEITITITNPQFTFAPFAMQGLKIIVNFIFFALLVDTHRRSLNKVCSCFEDSRLFPPPLFTGKWRRASISRRGEERGKEHEAPPTLLREINSRNKMSFPAPYTE